MMLYIPYTHSHKHTHIYVCIRAELNTQTSNRTNKYCMLSQSLWIQHNRICMDCRLVCECVRTTCWCFFCSVRSNISRLAWDEKGHKNEHLEARFGTPERNFMCFFFLRCKNLSCKSWKCGTERFQIDEDSETQIFLAFLFFCLLLFNKSTLHSWSKCIVSYSTSFTGLQLLCSGLDAMLHLHSFKKLFWKHSYSTEALSS